MKVFGLIGKSLIHSFSSGYFSAKFKKEGITDCVYKLFPIDSINNFPDLIKNNPEILGLNITIPYKQSIIPFLDKLDLNAENIGAVNTLRIENKDGRKKIIGFNTDFLGFSDSIKPYIKSKEAKALILGTGGSSLAVSYALKILNIEHLFVSRHPEKSNEINYQDINKQIIESHKIIINTTPLGMLPHVSDKPEIPYKYITQDHFLFDLVYNPEETLFLTEGKKYGTRTQNGLEMLGYQAEYSWKIWNSL